MSSMPMQESSERGEEDSPRGDEERGAEEAAETQTEEEERAEEEFALSAKLISFTME